jgi:hypothetical protein
VGFVFAAESPVELRHLGFTRDEHWNVHAFWMKLSNQTDKPHWLLFPWSGNRPLPERTKFPNAGSTEPLGRLTFDGKGGMVAIGVEFSTTLRAFRLPARTALELPEYNVTTHRGVTTDYNHIVVVEVDELLVNGKTPLEKWLPFQVGVFKQKNLNGGLVSGDFSRPAPGEKVEYLEAQGVHRWTVKFQNPGENGTETGDRRAY